MTIGILSLSFLAKDNNKVRMPKRHSTSSPIPASIAPNSNRQKRKKLNFPQLVVFIRLLYMNKTTSMANTESTKTLPLEWLLINEIRSPKCHARIALIKLIVYATAPIKPVEKNAPNQGLVEAIIPK